MASLRGFLRSCREIGKKVYNKTASIASVGVEFTSTHIVPFLKREAIPITGAVIAVAVTGAIGAVAAIIKEGVSVAVIATGASDAVFSTVGIATIVAGHGIGNQVQANKEAEAQRPQVVAATTSNQIDRKNAVLEGNKKNITATFDKALGAVNELGSSVNRNQAILAGSTTERTNTAAPIIEPAAQAETATTHQAFVGSAVESNMAAARLRQRKATVEKEVTVKADLVDAGTNTVPPAAASTVSPAVSPSAASRKYGSGVFAPESPGVRAQAARQDGSSQDRNRSPSPPPVLI